MPLFSHFSSSIVILYSIFMNKQLSECKENIYSPISWTSWYLGYIHSWASASLLIFYKFCWTFVRFSQWNVSNYQVEMVVRGTIAWKISIMHVFQELQLKFIEAKARNRGPEKLLLFWRVAPQHIAYMWVGTKKLHENLVSSIET